MAATTPDQASRKALHQRIANQAEEATPEQLEALSRAWSNVEHGPQGGHREVTETGTYNRTGTDHSTVDSRVDYHTTDHMGERRDKPTGFGNGPRDPGKHDD